VHPVTCSLLWERCLFDRLGQIFHFQIFRFRHPDYDADRAQTLISSSMSRHLSTCKISSKSMHAFLSNLANRQTDRQTSRAIAYNSFFVEGKLAIFLTSQSLYCFAICHVQDGCVLWCCRFQADVFEIPANVYIQHFKTYRFITEIHDILQYTNVIFCKFCFYWPL